MKNNPIIKILIERDGMSFEDAKELFLDLQERMLAGDCPEEVLYEIGLEPDYIFDLFPF